MVVLKDVELGLENWHKVYKDSSSIHVTFSLEGRFKSKDDKDENNDSEIEDNEVFTGNRRPIDLKMAELYENNIILLPYTFKMCLVVEYMYRYALQNRLFNITCRICKVNPKNWNITVNQSKERLMLLINKNK